MVPDMAAGAGVGGERPIGGKKEAAHPQAQGTNKGPGKAAIGRLAGERSSLTEWVSADLVFYR